MLGDLVGYGGRAERRHRPRPRARPDGGDSRQSRQGGVRARRRLQLQPGGAVRRRVDAPAADDRKPRLPPAAAARSDRDRRRAWRSATARRSTRITTSSTASTRSARSTRPRARSACSATPTCRWCSWPRPRPWPADIPDDELLTLRVRGGHALSDQPGIGRAAAGRRRARRLRVLRHQRPDGLRARRVRRQPPRRSGFRRRGCLRVLRIGSRSGGDASLVRVNSQLPTSNSQGESLERQSRCKPPRMASPEDVRTRDVRIYSLGSWELEVGS